MFEQPPLSFQEVFGRGFTQGLAAVFLSFILTFVLSFPSMRGPRIPFSLRTDLLVVRPILCTIGCGMALTTKDEKRAWFRVGAFASYALFLSLLIVLGKVRF